MNEIGRSRHEHIQLNLHKPDGRELQVANGEGCLGETQPEGDVSPYRLWDKR